MIVRQEAITFVKQILCLYFEQQNYDAVVKLLDEGVLCIGFKEHQLCKGKREAVDFLEKQIAESPQKYLIQSESYDFFIIDEQCCSVYGEICIALPNTTVTTDIRMSTICKEQNGELLLTHLHISYPTKSENSLEASLRFKTMEMQTVYDNVDFGIMKCQMDGSFKVRFLNIKALTMFGFSPDSFSGEFLASEFILEEDIPLLKQNTVLLKGEKDSISFKIRAKHQDGRILWLACYGARLKEKSEQMSALYTIRDVTEDESNRELLVAANQELVLSQKRYDIAISNMSDDFFDYIIDSKLIINYPSLGVRFGLPDVVEGGCMEIIESGIVHPSSIDAFKRLFERMDSGKRDANETIVLIDKDDKELVTEIKLTNIFDENNKPIRAVGLISDISSTVSLEQEQLYRKAMTSDRTLSYEANISKDTITTIDIEWARELGISSSFSYSQVINYLTDNLVHIDNCAMFRNTFERENLLRLCEAGKEQVCAEYRRKDKSGSYKWIRNETNIIRDWISKDIKIRCYVINIDDQKKLEIKAFEEQRFYEAMVSKDAIIYEMDVTNNIFIRGYERWLGKLGEESVGSYTFMLDIFIKNLVHPDDMAKFASCFLPEILSKDHKKGIDEISCEYRRLDENNEYRWFACTTHLFEDPTTGAVKAFSYEQDIDDDKKVKLALIYKSEHDSLTEFYNKGTTEQLINNYLKSAEGKTSKQAFIIFDIDFFKDFNDNFGHAFGDAVLSQTAKKVNELFREEDIVGRIGGDEFVVFMKNVPNREIVLEKAKSICDAVRVSYSKNNKAYKVSVSLGIAFSEDASNEYSSFYSHADTALYVAKQQGRDRFVAYEHGMKATGTSVNDMIENTVYESRSFFKNMSDYVFRILYESDDKINAINSVLELIGKQYNVSRTYIFEDSADGLYTTNTFEWCNEGIPPQKDNLAVIKYSEMGDYRKNFNEDGIFLLPKVSDANESIQRILKPQAVKSMLQFSFVKNGVFAGFVGFDECIVTRPPTVEDITELRSIASVLGVFVMEMRMTTLNEAMKNVALSIVNGLDSYAYVIDKNRYELLFINDKTLTIAPNAKVGQLCYSAFWGLSSPCERCPMAGLAEDSPTKCSIELYNPTFEVWTRATASWIDWTDGKRACLVDCFDITNYKIAGLEQRTTTI